MDELSSVVDSLDDDASLYEAGLSSFGTVELMVALENDFGIQFPDSLLTRETFESISSISAALERLQQANQAGAGSGRGTMEILSLGTAPAQGGGR